MDHKANMTDVAVAISGMGVFCPLGATLPELLENIREARCALKQIQGMDTKGLKIQHAAEIEGYDPRRYFSDAEAEELDPTAQFAILAARSALQHARLDLAGFVPDRVALVMGVCAGGQGGVDPKSFHDGRIQAKPDLGKFLSSAQYVQTDAVGDLLGLHGPRVTLSTACASSATALAYAYEVLQAGKADLVLAGGTDAFSLSTYAGFYALGAMAPGPCAPFSFPVGVSFGEGAGFVVLERMKDAAARGASIHGELVSYGASSDAHHITAPHPAGEGLCRAMRLAVARSGLRREQIDYINAHGTGTRDNDTAETLAIRQLFDGAPSIPPVSATKSYFGHTLGAAGVLEFIVSLLSSNEGILPATLNFNEPRPGCDLDYVPNHARPHRVNHFLSNSAAFGGVNTVLLGSSRENCQPRPRPGRQRDDVCISGMGIISSVGLSPEQFADSLRSRRFGGALVERFDTAEFRSRHSALVKDFNPRRLLPWLDVRRLDALNQYAAVAAGLAFKDACLQSSQVPEERIGVVVGLTRGPVTTQQHFLESLEKDGLESLPAKYFPAMVVSTVAGQVAGLLKLKGLNSTVVDGTTAGLQALLHASEVLRLDDSQDAIVLVAADEIGSSFFHAFQDSGLLADGSGACGESLCPYDPQSAGTVLGEGAAAFVIERVSSAHKRGARIYGEIRGCGQAADACQKSTLEPEGVWLTRAMEKAMAESGLELDDIGFIYGHGRGLRDYDAREIKALQRLLSGRPVPVCCALGNTGLAEAACGAFSVAAALLGLKNGEAYPIATNGVLPEGLAFVQGEARTGQHSHCMVVGGTEHGNNAAVVLSRDCGRKES
jgi:3-oxoacyl-[acyl-carrier-protein] synthase II